MKRDQFLRDFRRQPDPKFADTLYQRIKNMSQAVPPSPKRQAFSYPTLARAAAFALVLVAALALMPSVRAALTDTIQQVGQTVLRLTDTYPGVDNPVIIPDTITTLTDAQEQLSFPFALPTYIPDGLVLNENEVRIQNIREGVMLSWSDPTNQHHWMHLHASPADPEINFVVGPDSVTEVIINGKPASLIDGSWDADTQEWSTAYPSSLRWVVSNTEYSLTVSEQTIELSEMIQIAESITND